MKQTRSIALSLVLLFTSIAKDATTCGQGQRSTVSRNNRGPQGASHARTRAHQAAQTKPSVSFHESLLATITESAYGIQFSPDGTKVAYVAREGGSEFVVLGRSKGPQFDRVGVPVFSPNSTRLAYTTKQGTSSSVMIDSIKGPEFDSTGDIVFSPDSSKTAYIATQGGQAFVVVNNRKGPPFYWVGDLQFSPNGNNVVYIASEVLSDENAAKRLPGGNSAEIVEKNGKWFPIGRLVVVDGRRYGEIFTNVSRLTISKAGQIMYAASNNFTGNGVCKYCIVVGYNWLEADTDAQPVFSSDGKTFAYLTRRCLVRDCAKSVHSVVSGDQREPEYEGSTQRIAFSSDGTRVGYEVSLWTPHKAYMVIGGKKGPEYDWTSDQTISTPVFSPDGKHFAYRAGEKGKDMIIIDGNRGPLFDWAGTPAFSPDSKKVVYYAKRSKKVFVVVIDKNGLEFDSKEFDESFTPLVFSPDSGEVAYGVRLGRELWWKETDIR